MTRVRMWRWGLLLLVTGIACAVCIVRGQWLAACLLMTLIMISVAVLRGLRARGKREARGDGG